MMQGQGSTSNSNPETIHVHGIIATDLRLDQHNVDSDDTSVRNGHVVMSSVGQSSSNLNAQNQISYVHLLSQDNGIPSGYHQGLEGRHSENGRVRNGPPIVQGTISGALPNNLDLNATYEGNSNDACQEMGAGLSLNISHLGGPEADSNTPQPGTDSSNALLISSGISGYVLEENNDRRDTSSDDRRLSCKRKAPEGSAAQLSLGGTSSSSQQARNSDQQVVARGNPNSSLNIFGASNSQPNVNHFGRLDIGLGAPSCGNQTSSIAGTVVGAHIGAATVNHQSSRMAANGHEGASVMHQSSNVSGNGHGNQASTLVGQAENFQRNIRLRRNENQQGVAPSSLSTWNSNIQFPSETDMSFDPWDYLMVPRSSSAFHAIPELHPLVEVPELFHTQLYQGIPMAIANGSSSSSAPVNQGYIQNQEENRRNNIRNMRHPSESERENLSEVGRNLNFARGNPNFPRNVASTSQNGTNSNVWLPTAPVWLTNPLMGDLYFDRFAEYGLLEHQEEGSYFQMNAAREMENSVRDGNTRHPQRPPRSRLITRAERQAVGYPDVLPAFRSLSPLQRRSTLVSGVHNALALVHRGGALRVEDVMVIDNSVLLGDSEDEEDDTHEDLRLDVDNMSYEELLALQDQIGSVCTGLSEEAIRARLRIRKHQSTKVVSDNDEPCCICQEEYADGVDLGKLDCGHDFHANCIRKWLRLKNSCPICKLTALAGRKRVR